MAAREDGSLSCFYTNASTLSNKMGELKTLVERSNYKVIGVTEINPSSSKAMKKDKLNIDNYKLFLAKRKHLTVKSRKMKPRGVCLYIHETLKFRRYNLNAYVGFRESVWVEVMVDGTKVLVGCIYRSPNTSDADNNEALRTLMEKLNSWPHVLVMGDFNYPALNWTGDGNATISGRAGHDLFLMSTRQVSLTQHIKVPTMRPQKQNVLDLVFSRGSCCVNDLSVSENTLGNSDHYIITFEVKTHTSETAVKAAAAAAKAEAAKAEALTKAAEAATAATAAEAAAEEALTKTAAALTAEALTAEALTAEALTAEALASELLKVCL